jgi:hypothetical protein
MRKLSVAFLTMVLVFSPGSSAHSQDTAKGDAVEDCPMHKQHHATVEKHGDQAMGFSHNTTTHHFRIAPDGGAIEVTANDPNDKASTEAIRSHLSQVAARFGNGDFSAPMFVHDSIPPGVTTMKILKAAIHYTYQEIASGGRVLIATRDPIAVAAIHDFLRFQISEHHTGDRLAVEDAH